MKDLFSEQAKAYAQFRPHYPKELFDHLLMLLPAKDMAWDCGTGNGQVASVLADHFTQVYATDISRQQLNEAVQKANIYYSVQRAEKTLFAVNQFDLITVAQAIHWFQFEAFYAEAKRTLKPGGLIAVIGYGLVQTEKPLQKIIDHFYTKIIGPYWDAERHYIDEGLQTIPFPFTEMPMPAFQITYTWRFEQLIGYMGTWSAVKHYVKQNQQDPVLLIKDSLQSAWGDQTTHPFTFPVLLRVGR